MGAQPDESAGSRVVLVSDAGDALVQGFVEALSGAGATVETVGDVYSAIGDLAGTGGRTVRMMLVDVRAADRAELRVFDVAHRYYPWVICGAMASVIEPPGSGHEPAGMTAAQAAARFRTASGASESAAIEAMAPTPRAAAASEPSPPDGANGPELKLHDAVRLRMSNDLGTAAIRRTPPRVAPQAIVEGAAAPGAEVTPAELDALLRPEDGTDSGRTEGAA